ncbi:MAG: hypothetical protein JO069_08210, partial [Verrucomicrobia bacterium]|nr:hypothetical protein [Verrucomicrobiota bacterium]
MAKARGMSIGEGLARQGSTGAARPRAWWVWRLRQARAAPLALLAAFYALVGPGLALDPQRRLSEYRSMVWSHDTGLVQEWIDSIAQTPDGHLWLGGHEGLTRFDAKRFVSLAPFKDVMAPNCTVNDLRVDAAGTLWVASYGAIYCQRAGENFRRFDAAQGLPADWVRCLLFTSDGRLWAGTDSHGLFFLDNGRFVPYVLPPPLPCRRVTALAQDADGGLWVGSAAGLARIGRPAEPTRSYTQADGLPDNDVSALVTDARGQLWAGTHRGLARLDHNRFVAVPLGPLGCPAIGALMVDRHGLLWVACVNAGLERLDPATLRSESVTFPRGPADGNFKRIFEDREGNVWLGSDAGVRCLSDTKFTVISSQDGLPNRTVNAVLSDRAGKLWIGTEAGLALWRQGRLEPPAVRLEGQEALRQRVTSLHEDWQGTLWFGTGHGSLYALRDGCVAEVPLQQSYALASAYAPVSVIRDDGAGTLWVGTFGGGLRAVAGGKVIKALTRDDGLKSNFVTDLAVSPAEDALWVATDHGVSMVKAGKLEAPVAAGAPDPEEKFVSLYLDAEGALWAGTMGGGINRLKNGRWGPSFCTKAQGLFSNEIFTILEDQRGHLAQLWCSSDRGIVSIPKAELDEYFDGRRSSVTCQVFGREDGLRSVQCAGANQPSGCVTPEGQLCFPTTDGVAMIAPEKVHHNSQAPLTQIERMLVDVTQDVPLRPDRKPALDAGTHSLEFDYAGLSFSAPHRVLFKYQLEGFDKRWVEAGGRAEAYYTNLAAGAYRFRVIACNNDGVWTPKEQAASVSFVILPHFYQTFWSYLLCAFVVGMALWVLARWRLQQVLAERNRLARELHDTLAQSFLALIWQIESAELALGKGRGERARASLQRAKGQARDGLRETRRA